MKDPAVLFYFQDFLVGTEFMTDNEVGKYIRILCHQADKGALSESQVKRICRTNKIPDAILEKLSRDDAGNFYQHRMKIEKEKREKHSKHQSENAKKRWGKNECHGNATAMPLLNENENENVIKELYKGIEIFFDEDCRPKTEKQIQDWYDTLDKLIRIDGYTPEHIHDVIKRTRMDDFWRQNFLSVLKLRKKNKEGIPYFTVFEKKLYNEVNKRDSGATIEQLAEVAYRSQFEESNQ